MTTPTAASLSFTARRTVSSILARVCAVIGHPSVALVAVAVLGSAALRHLFFKKSKWIWEFGKAATDARELSRDGDNGLHGYGGVESARE